MTVSGKAFRPYCRSEFRMHDAWPAIAVYDECVQCRKGKVLPYLLPSVGPGADPGVQAVSLQVTLSHPPGGRLPLLSTRPAVTSVAFTTRQHTSDSSLLLIYRPRKDNRLSWPGWPIYKIKNYKTKPKTVDRQIHILHNTDTYNVYTYVK